jgi:hypothetical protein
VASPNLTTRNIRAAETPAHLIERADRLRPALTGFVQSLGLVTPVLAADAVAGMDSLDVLRRCSVIYNALRPTEPN